METTSPEFLNNLIQSLRTQRDWVTEIDNLAMVVEKLDELKKVTSARELSKLIGRSKTWVGVSFVLIKGIKLYPEVTKCSTRNKAYATIQRKNRMRRFLES